jgi:hypothetical protein
MITCRRSLAPSRAHVAIAAGLRRAEPAAAMEDKGRFRRSIGEGE